MSSRVYHFHPFERRGVFVLSLVLIFIVIFGVAYLIAHQSYTKAIRASIRSNETRAILLAKLILEHQRAAIGILQSYAGRPLLVDSVKKRDFEGALSDLIDLTKHNPEMDWPFLSNPDSTVWVNYPVDRQVMNKDLTHRDWYKGVSKEWEPYISSVYKLIVGEKDLAVAIAVPIFDENRKVIGILATAQSTDFFQNTIREIGLSADAKITLIDREGHIIYSNGFPYTKEVADYPSFQFVAKATKGEKGGVEVRDASDGSKIKYLSFVPVEGIGWSVIVERPRSEVFRSEVPHFALIGLISALLYGVAVLSLVHFRERHRQMNELRKLNEELDDRVKERTAQLRQSETRYKLLSETSGRLLAADDPQRIIEELCRDVMKHLDCHAFFNFLFDELAGRLRLNACAGIPDQEVRKIEWLDLGVAVCGCVAQGHARIIAEDILHVSDPRTDLVKSYGIQAYCCHPLMAQNRLIGTLSFGTKTRPRFTPEEVDLMRTVTNQVSEAMERIRAQEALRQHGLELQRLNETLEERVKERTMELESVNKALTESQNRLQYLAESLLEFQEEERKRLAGEVHDSFASSLSAIKHRIESMKGRNGPQDGDWEDLKDQIQVLIDEARRLQMELRPSILDDLGIISALGWFMRGFQKTYSHIAVTNEIDVKEQEIPNQVKIPIFRICQEAFNNAVKHSQAKVIRFALEKRGASLQLEIQDDGVGIGSEILALREGRGRGLGLLSMEERASLSGGVFTIHSEPGKGTTIRVSWPFK